MKGSIQEEPVFSFQRQDQLLLEEKRVVYVNIVSFSNVVVVHFEVTEDA